LLEDTVDVELALSEENKPLKKLEIEANKLFSLIEIYPC
jgi:hypothetical protein